MCTIEEIAMANGCCRDTIERRFRKEIDEGRAICKTSLRREQFQRAMKGNVVMLIWLGKQYLKQTDKNEVTSKGERGGEFTEKDKERMQTLIEKIKVEEEEASHYN